MIKQYEPWIDRDQLLVKMVEYIQSGGYFTEFERTKAFEFEVKTRFDIKHCFMVNNGTISLSLALLAYDIKPGDLVLVPNITMIATANAVRFIGAEPVFIDVDLDNLCMDLRKARDVIEANNKAKALIYVTLNGRSHEFQQLKGFFSYCKAKGIKVVEDNAQSFGSRYTNDLWINYPDEGIGSYSFSMPKIITTGQGGCLVTGNDELAEKIRRLKDFGRYCGGADIHDHFGINAKFTDLQAVLGLCQFKNIDERIREKRNVFERYRELLKEIPEIKFLDTNLKFVTPWFVDIYIEKREELSEFLKSNGIQTRPIYPPLTSQKVYQGGQEIDLDNSVRISKNGLWLPSSINITENQINQVCDTIKIFYNYKSANLSNANYNPVIIDICKGYDLYQTLRPYNSKIDEACSGFMFVEGREYDVKKKEASWWFDPNNVRKLPISHVYPACLPIQKDEKLCLKLYAPNYFSLLLINSLYKNKEIIIEEQAGGMGALLFYLSKLGFKNFNMIENFSQLPRELFDSMLSKGEFYCSLNNYQSIPKVLNLVGYTHFVKEIVLETELVIVYNRVGIIKDGSDKTFSYTLNSLDNYIEMNNKTCLAIDKYGLTKAYCNIGKFEEFRSKLVAYGI